MKEKGNTLQPDNEDFYLLMKCSPVLILMCKLICKIMYLFHSKNYYQVLPDFNPTTTLLFILFIYGASSLCSLQCSRTGMFIYLFIF